MITLDKKIKNYKSLQTVVALILLLLLLVGICFSPHLAFWTTIALLLTKYGNIKVTRNGIAIISAIMIIFTVTSREIGVSLSDDLTQIYMPIVQSQIEGFGIFGTWMGVEFGYGAVINILLNIVPKPSPRIVLFYSVTLSTFLYLLWMIRFALPRISTEHRGLILAISLSFIQVGFLSQFLRQEIATPILLMSIFLWEENKKRSSWLLLLTATIFHTSSLLIFVFYFIFSRCKIRYIIVGACCFFATIGLLIFRPSVLVSLFDLLHLSFLGNKLVYYETAVSNSISDSLKGGKFFFIILFMIIIRWKVLTKNINEFSNSDFFSKLVKFSFWGCIYTIPLLLLPNASRFFLVIPGFLFPICIYAIFKRYMSFIHVFFIFFILISILVPGRLNGGVNEGFNIWIYYPWINEQLFYYLNWSY
ncbi:EpsG family protein [Pluralibacter gergoviae]|uniref:EpsG family protein n=2 Tax=Pluralibacter gergoviae TaxID=61647 RepID=UPI0025C99678|nr:EpsG family protein [Pluralibacter gergoviae]EKW9974986.1 EpsG family protein [Pluralibacter gergoviae]MDU4001315.1 EpsG family protein [Pluralibacter gergoviae]HDS1078870.1 EpsG family protein [Pluralibacter gergoviae]